MNAERVLVASESIGDGRWFTEKAVAYSGGRVIFGKPIGANQGVQFPSPGPHERGGRRPHARQGRRALRRR